MGPARLLPATHSCPPVGEPQPGVDVGLNQSLAARHSASKPGDYEGTAAASTQPAPRRPLELALLAGRHSSAP